MYMYEYLDYYCFDCKKAFHNIIDSTRNSSECNEWKNCGNSTSISAECPDLCLERPSPRHCPNYKSEWEIWFGLWYLALDFLGITDIKVLKRPPIFLKTILFKIFLRSLMPKKSSGVQKSYFTPNMITKSGFPFQCVVEHYREI